MVSKKKAAPRKKATKAVQVTPKPVRKVMLEINTNRVEESISQAVDQIQYWYRQGMIRKIRLKYKGKPILPDIPISYFLLAQAATFFLTGIVRALAISFGTKIFFEVEMINDAEERLKRGRQLYLAGEIDEAKRLFEEALELDPRYAEAYLHLGIIAKIRNDPTAAAHHFLKAQRLDPSGTAGIEAAKNRKKLLPPAES
ncbi:MAG TPA: tetratricopeptide repeat protein [Acidobacteriota bacterium]|nr:tetratricopeptide repeat protein [Acidobacteriota bacterium]